MHRAGPGERGGGSYGRRAVATAEWADMQISVDGKGVVKQGLGLLVHCCWLPCRTWCLRIAVVLGDVFF